MKILPNIWKNKKCSKPPTSYVFGCTLLWKMPSSRDLSESCCARAYISFIFTWISCFFIPSSDHSYISYSSSFILGGAKKSSKKVQELNQVSPGFPGVSRGFQGFPMDGSGRISLQSKVKPGRLLIEPLVWLDQGAQLPARVPGWAGNKSHALPCPFTCFSQFRKGNVIKLLSKSGVQGKYVEHLGRKLR